MRQLRRWLSAQDPRWIALAAAGALLIVGGIVFVVGHRTPPRPTVRGTSRKPVVSRNKPPAAALTGISVGVGVPMPTDLANTQFSIALTTTFEATGTVLYGTSTSALTQTAFDNRDGGSSIPPSS